MSSMPSRFRGVPREADLVVDFVKNGRRCAIPPLHLRVSGAQWRTQLRDRVQAHVRSHFEDERPLLVLVDDEYDGRVLLDNGRRGSGVVRRLR